MMAGAPIMHFATPEFALFFVLTLTAAWAARRHRVAHKLVLLAASYLFYAKLGLAPLALLCASSLSNWALGEAIVRSRSPAARSAALGAAVAANLGLLGAFKYYGFFQQTASEAAELLGLTSHLPLVELLLPVGISFYTFQGLAYVIDLHRGKDARAASLLDFLLFAAFFPKVLSGPICRASELLPQIAAGPADRVDLPRAMSLVLSGLFKKAVLATVISVNLVDEAFLAPENHSGLALLVAAYAYTIQVYCDFSGYTDMARGIALLLGYELPENFHAPYAATDPGDFWRRWHMTFSSWLRDYVYFPLGGSRGPLARTLVNLMITFLACGLWHGASWGFVLWGAVHGAALCAHKLIRDAKRAAGWQGPDPGWWVAGGWLLTFHVVVASRILFQAADLETAGLFLARAISLAEGGAGPGPWVVAASLAGFALNFVGGSLRDAFVSLHRLVPRPLAPVLWATIAAVLLVIQPEGVAPYIYFRF